MAKTAKRTLGDIGEKIAAEFLIKRGIEVMDRNYLRKWGEIDIVGKKGDLIRFVEVKSVSCENLGSVYPEQARGVTHGTSAYRPEENVHPHKLKRLSRAIQTYLLEKNLECEWQLDVITVRIDEKSRRARVEMIENVII